MFRNWVVPLYQEVLLTLELYGIKHKYITSNIVSKYVLGGKLLWHYFKSYILNCFRICYVDLFMLQVQMALNKTSATVLQQTLMRNALRETPPQDHWHPWHKAWGDLLSGHKRVWEDVVLSTKPQSPSWGQHFCKLVLFACCCFCSNRQAQFVCFHSTLCLL